MAENRSQGRLQNGIQDRTQGRENVRSRSGEQDRRNVRTYGRGQNVSYGRENSGMPGQSMPGRRKTGGRSQGREYVETQNRAGGRNAPEFRGMPQNRRTPENRGYAGTAGRAQGVHRGRERQMSLNEEEYRKERARRKRERLIRRRRKVLLGLIAACIVLVYGVVNLILFAIVSRYPKDVICKNIYIGAADVSGMSKKEAKSAIEKQLEKDRAKTVTVKFGDKSTKGKLEDFGIRYTGVDEAVDEAMDYGKKGSLWSRFRKLRKTSKKVVIEEKFAIDKEAGAAALSNLADSLTERAKNATITKDGEEFKIEKEQDGETINAEDFLAKVEKHLNDTWNHKGFSVKGKAEKEKAAVTSKDLESVSDELSSFSTDAGSGERVQNLQTGVEKVNGTVLMPGEIFSMEEKTKPYTEENGYVMGGSYEGGRVVESYGGGICQVSTTLYNAVIYAELEVVERYPHSMLVNYVSPSRDAAVAEGLLDFKFKNNYDTPIYINAGIDDNNQLYFEIYGKDTREEGRTIEFESEVLSTEEAGTTYEENSEAPFGQIEAVSSAHEGTEAMLWKIVYQDGEQVSREEFNTSSYQKADTIYEVGTNTDNADAAARLREAIATQDEAQIYAAIGGTQ